MKHEDLLKFFLEFKKGRSPEKIDQFLYFQNEQVARENRSISGKLRGLPKLFLEFEKR
jgi:hypothetical protein